MKTIIKITKQEAIDAWKRMNKTITADVVEIEETALTSNGTTHLNGANWGISPC